MAMTKEDLLASRKPVKPNGGKHAGGSTVSRRAKNRKRKRKRKASKASRRRNR